MYEDIKEQFKSVISYSQGIENPQIDYLFNNWEKNKEKFIKRFGGLIYECPKQIEFTLDENQKRDRAMEFANSVCDTFNNPQLASFIDENINTFFDNKVSISYRKEIPKGMKLLKAFKFFEPNKAILKNIQDIASQIIQENKIKGTLCFSVHPLDFLSSSENTYSWRSCHSLDGDYRAGNLSYMVDNSTFMVYLKGEDNQKLNGFGDILWNSKKWRVLFHTNTSDKILFSSRQYPFGSKSGLDLILKIYNILMEKESTNPYYSPKYFCWHVDYIDGYIPCDSKDENDICPLKNKYLVYHNDLVKLSDVVIEGNNCLNYNDILKSSCYKYPYYTVLDPFGSYHSVKNLLEDPVEIGQEVVCLQCGKELLTNSETMRCYDCEITYGSDINDNIGECDCCGRRMYIDDATGVDTGGLICDNCFENHAFICDNCSGIYYNEDKVFFMDDNNKSYWFCKNCYEHKD